MQYKPNSGRISFKRRRDVEAIELIFLDRINRKIFLKMRLGFVILLVLQTKFTFTSSEEKEHVHFKIYVPEIIKHHIHTKTIFIHVHEPKKKSPPKKKEHLESHYDDWSVWSGYSNYDHNGGSRSAVKSYGGHQESPNHQQEDQGYVTPYEGLLTAPGPPKTPVDNAYPSYYRESPKASIPHYDDYQGNYQPDNEHSASPPVPPKSVFRNGVTGYSYPPQYQIHENVVEDVPKNSLENYKSSHEEGHSNRHESEQGHLYTNELENYYDDKHEEGSEAVSAESKEVHESYNNNGYRYGDRYAKRTMKK